MTKRHPNVAVTLLNTTFNITTYGPNIAIYNANIAKEGKEEKLIVLGTDTTKMWQPEYC